MKYVKMITSNGYAGCNDEQYLCYEDNVDEMVIQQDLAEFIEVNAEQYEYVASGWGEDFPSEEDIELYYEGCNGDWFYITEEEYLQNTHIEKRILNI